MFTFFRLSALFHKVFIEVDQDYMLLMFILLQQFIGIGENRPLLLLARFDW